MKPHAAALSLALLFGQTAFAEEIFVSAQFSQQLENGVALSGALSTADQIVAENGQYRITGALYSSEIGASQLTVVLPAELVEGFSIEQGRLQSGNNAINYEHKIVNGAQDGTTYHFLRVGGLVDDRQHYISIVDDPHPCLGKVAAAAMFIAVCGGLHVYNTQSECGEGA